MQRITPEIRAKVREISSEIRRIDDTIQNHYDHIANYEASPYPKHCDMADVDIAMRETDIQRIMQRRTELTLSLRKINHGLPVRRHHIH